MATQSVNGDAGTAARILDVAEQLVQVRGFNGFSYADIAAELGITKAALHYHFAGKADLGEALIVRYASRFAEALAAIDATADGSAGAARARLGGFADLYLEVLRNSRMCLCGMLAAEYQTLPQPMQNAVLRFFDDSEAWLGSVLESGRADGSLSFAGPASETARMIIGSLEGAMLVARPYGDVRRFQAAAQSLLAGLSRPADASAPAERAEAIAGD